MAIQNTFAYSYTLNSAGGTNSPAPANTFSSTFSIGTLAVGPIAVAVTTSPTALPLTPVTGIYNLEIRHTGASGDAAITINACNQASASNTITLAPGGAIILINATLPGSGASVGQSCYTNWRISCASATTTATVAMVYT